MSVEDSGRKLFSLRKSSVNFAFTKLSTTVVGSVMVPGEDKVETGDEG